MGCPSPRPNASQIACVIECCETHREGNSECPRKHPLSRPSHTKRKKSAVVVLPGRHRRSNRVYFAGDRAPQSVGVAHGRALDSGAYPSWKRKPKHRRKLHYGAEAEFSSICRETNDSGFLALWVSPRIFALPFLLILNLMCVSYFGFPAMRFWNFLSALRFSLLGRG